VALFNHLRAYRSLLSPKPQQNPFIHPSIRPSDGGGGGGGRGRGRGEQETRSRNSSRRRADGQVTCRARRLARLAGYFHRHEPGATAALGRHGNRIDNGGKFMLRNRRTTISEIGSLKTITAQVVVAGERSARPL